MRCSTSRICQFIWVALIVFSGSLSKAQTLSATTTITLEEVNLQATKTETPRSKLPFSVSVQALTKTQKIHQQLSLQEYLVAVPGLFAQNAKQLCARFENIPTWFWGASCFWDSRNKNYC